MAGRIVSSAPSTSAPSVTGCTHKPLRDYAACKPDPVQRVSKRFITSTLNEKWRISTSKRWRPIEEGAAYGEGIEQGGHKRKPPKHQITDVEKLWNEYFADPTNWWDNRGNKIQIAEEAGVQIHPRGPDFKHKSTNQALWIDSSKNPWWVEDELERLDGAKGKYPKSKNKDEENLRKGYSSNPTQHSGKKGRNGVWVQILPRGTDYKKKSTNKALRIVSEKKPKLVAGQLKAGATGLLGSGASTTSERGPRKKAHKNSSGTCGDVRTLCKTGRLKDALQILNQGGILADSSTYVCLLQECIKVKGLVEGKQVHAHMIQNGFKPKIFLLNTLINMHAKCGSIEDARLVFDKMHVRDLSTWNIMVAGYAKRGCGRQALETYEQMIQEGMIPNHITFVCVLKACASLAALQEGKEVHADVMKSGLVPDITVETALVDMYAKCGSINDANGVFLNMAQRNVVSWNAMITGYAQHGCGREALETYEQMIREGMTSNQVTFLCVLKACVSLAALEKGKEIHADIIKAGILPDISLENTLVDMYAKCGSINDANRVFHKMAERDVVSWNAMISGYAQHGCGREALETYEQMIHERVTPNHVTFVCVLKACASMTALEKGAEVHADIMKAGIVPDTILNTALVDMYAKCGNIKDARQVFDNMGQRNVVSWNTMIAGYAQHGYGTQALEIYQQMTQERMPPNHITFVCILKACASLAALEKGKEVHVDIMRAEIVPDIILDTTLVDMYAKCGNMNGASRVFDNMGQRNVVSWNAMISGYAHHGCGREALEMYEQMMQEGVTPDHVTFVCILNACASLAALEKGKKVHADIIKTGIVPDTILENALVDMYCKCGNIHDANQVFDNMPQRDVVSWNAMIAGYAQHGCGRKALGLFKQMQQKGFKPNGITFVCVLSACSHGGLVDEGRHYWDSLTRDHGLTPTWEHFGCMVDLLGRAGHLHEAEDLINKMPAGPDAVVWRALLGACNIHGNVEIAERAAKYVLK